jgi:hypothetical protein
MKSADDRVFGARFTVTRPTDIGVEMGLAACKVYDVTAPMPLERCLVEKQEYGSTM